MLKLYGGSISNMYYDYGDATSASIGKGKAIYSICICMYVDFGYIHHNT